MGNLAQAVGNKLTENRERNNNQDQFPASMYDGLHKIMQVLAQSREEAQNGMVAIGRKSHVMKDNIKDEVLESANTPIQNHSDREWKEKDESMVRRNHPKTPYHFGGGGETRSTLY